MSERIAIGHGFAFRWAPRWMIWKRGFGGAQVLSYDELGDVVHLRIFGVDESSDDVISHLPILWSCVAPFIIQEYAPSGSAGETSDTWKAISAWRELHAKGEARAFSLSLGSAVDWIWRDTFDSGNRVGHHPINVITAYPVESSDGSFNNIRVVTADGALTSASS